MDNGVAHDVGLSSGRDGHSFYRAAKNAYAVRKIRLLRAALGEGNAFVQTQKCPAIGHALWWRLVLDHDLQIPDAVAELRRQLVKRIPDEAREARAPHIGLYQQGKYPLRPLFARRVSGELVAGCTGRSHTRKRARSQTARTGLGQADLAADLAQGQSTSVRQHEDAAFERCEVAKRARDERPTFVAMFGCATRLGDVADPLERDFDVRRIRRRLTAVLAGSLGRAKGAARAAGERVALAKRVEDLASHSARGVRTERRASVAAIALRGLDQADEPPRNQIFAVRAAAARIEGSRSYRSCELKVRDDAVISDRKCRIGHDAPPLRRGPYAGPRSVSIAN